jgi:ABC-type sugar transport system ATPase subunit
MNRLEVSGLRKTFAGGVLALDAVSFAVAAGEFFCVVGPTNAGKSTLLKTVAGLHRPDAGCIRMDGRDVTALEPRARQVSLLFQNIALFPTQTGFDNIAYPLKRAGMAPAEIARRVQAVADLLKVSHLLARLPRTFSGGEQQRVAIGRAIAHPSSLLMLDEPLTNLDARLRIALRIEFKALHKRSGQTMLYVTHDQVEAMSLSDRVLVLNQGRIEQIGTPDEVYHRPATRFVAEFLGTPPMNLLDAELSIDGGGPVLQGRGFRFSIDLPPARLQGLPARLAFGIRPEEVRAAPIASEATPQAGEVTWVERLGSRNILDVKLGEQIFKVSVRPDHPVRRVGQAWFGFPAGSGHWLDRDSDRFIHLNG